MSGVIDCVMPVPLDAPARPSRHPELGLPVRRWGYADAHGALCFEVWRFERDGAKEFRPLSLWREGQGSLVWRWRAPPGPRPLYGLAPLARRPHDPVIVVEGEKSAQAAGDLFQGHVAVTSHNGASGARFSDWSALAGREVTIWPDNDEPGRAYARDVAALLSGVAARVRVVELSPGFPPGWDLGDHNDVARAQPEPGDKASLVRLLAAACELPSETAPAASSEALAPARVLRPGITGAALQDKVFAPIKWIVPGYFVEGLTLIAGKPKLGKSWFALNLAASVSAGAQAFGAAPCEAGDVLMLALEDSERRLQTRMQQMLGDARWPARVTYHTEWPRCDAGGLEDIVSWIEGAAKPRLVVIDVWAKVRGRADGRKSLYADDFETLGMLQQIALKHCIAIVALHHASKRDNPEDPFDLVSGTTGLTAAADSVMVLRKEAGQADAVLYGRGRDLPVFEKAMRFDETRGLWNVLGDADAYRLSTVEARIEKVLRSATAPMRPKEVADILEANARTVKSTLHRMANAGKALNSGGKYAAQS
jgi:AAA domain